MLSDDLHESRENIRQGMGRQGLLEGSKYLEGAAGIVPGGAGEGCLQGNFTQVLFQVET